MKLGLKGKVVVITGGATGIGKALAHSFSREGCKIAVCSRSKEKIAAIYKDFQAKGCEILAEVKDAANFQDMNIFAERIMKEYGRIDVWINNAGICPHKLLMEMTEDEWDEVMTINLKSVFLGARIAASYMKEQGGGVILNASSYAALIPSAGTAAYAASKAAVLSLTKTLAAELAPFNIRVNAYIPGVIRTDMTKGVIQQKEKKLLEHIALNRFGAPEEVAEGLVFLASEAASYITGTYIEMSGGKLCVQNPLYAW